MSSRFEELVTALLNDEAVDLVPRCRMEQYLKNCIDKNGTVGLPVPKARAEILLYQLAEQLEGGSGDGTGVGSVEGTAIPVEGLPQKIYFNLNNSVKKSNDYLSQLTYVQTDLLEYPAYAIAGYTYNENSQTVLIVALQIPYVDTPLHQISLFHIQIDGTSSGHLLFSSVPDSYEVRHNNGFYADDNDLYGKLGYGVVYSELDTEQVTPLTEFMGIPIGLENEKIKNVLSITPFGASGGTSTNSPLAYTVSSVDELPSDAVDGSTAIVGGGEKIFILNENLGTNVIPSFDAKFRYTDNLGDICNCIRIEYKGDTNSLTYIHTDGTRIDVYIDGSWEDDFCRYITVSDTECRTNEALNKFLSSHSTLSDETIVPKLYKKENGEWVFIGNVGEDNTEQDKPTAYIVSSIDELPSDAVDGSTAIVEWQREVMANTTWLLDEYIASSGTQSEIISIFEFDHYDISGSGAAVGIAIIINDYGDYVDISYLPSYGGIYDDGWSSERRIIKIKGEPSLEMSKWIKSHGTKQSEGVVYTTAQSLYTHENGEWVYKCEVT